MSSAGTKRPIAGPATYHGHGPETRIAHVVVPFIRLMQLLVPRPKNHLYPRPPLAVCFSPRVRGSATNRFHRLTGETKRTALILARSANFSTGKRPTSAFSPWTALDVVKPKAFS